MGILYCLTLPLPVGGEITPGLSGPFFSRFVALIFELVGVQSPFFIRRTSDQRKLKTDSLPPPFSLVLQIEPGLTPLFSFSPFSNNHLLSFTLSLMTPQGFCRAVLPATSTSQGFLIRSFVPYSFRLPPFSFFWLRCGSLPILRIFSFLNAPKPFFFVPVPFGFVPLIDPFFFS